MPSSPLELPPEAVSFGCKSSALSRRCSKNSCWNEWKREWLASRPLSLPLPGSRPASRGTAKLLPYLSQGDPVRACLVSFSFPPRVSGWDPQGLRCIGLSGSWICRLLGKAPALLWSWCILLLVDEETDAQAGRAVGQGWGCSPHRAALRMWPCCVRPSCVFIGSADLY